MFKKLELYTYACGDFVCSYDLELASLEDVETACNLVLSLLYSGIEHIEVFEQSGKDFGNFETLFSAFDVFSKVIKCLGRFYYSNKMQSEQSTFYAHAVQALHVKYRNKRPLAAHIYSELQHERNELNCNALNTIYAELLKVFNK